MSAASPDTPGLRLLVVDDERPALDELAYLLRRDDRVAEVLTCDSATQGLRILREEDVDGVFLDVSMPGLDGLELAAILGRFRRPPPIVFVTAHDSHAVEAFDLQALDYVLKPVRPERLAEAVRRVIEGGERPAEPVQETQIAVERGGVTRFIDRGDVTHIEAQGDYARLHTATDSHLVRLSLASLEDQWGPAGFVRIHRSSLVALAHVTEVRVDDGRCRVVVATEPPAELAVSRRHTRALRDLLMRNSS